MTHVACRVTFASAETQKVIAPLATIYPVIYTDKINSTRREDARVGWRFAIAFVLKLFSLGFPAQ